MLLAGEVAVIHGNRLVATRGPGSHLSEIALLERCPRTATLVAKTPVSVAVATSGEFTSMLQLVPEIAERLDGLSGGASHSTSLSAIRTAWDSDEWINLSNTCPGAAARTAPTVTLCAVLLSGAD